MKVNLVNTECNVKSDYVNVCETALEESIYKQYKCIDGIISRLENQNGKLFEYAQITELCAEEILQLYLEKDIPDIINVWYKNIAYNGKLFLTFPDVYKAANDLSYRELTTEEFDLIIRGKNRNFQSCLDPTKVLKILRDCGFIIEKCKINEYTTGIVSRKI